MSEDGAYVTDYARLRLAFQAPFSSTRITGTFGKPASAKS